MAQNNKIEVILSAVDRGLTKGVNRARGSLSKLTDTVGVVSAGVAGLSAVVGAVGAGLGALVITSANEAREMENLSRLAKMNAQDFQLAAYATNKFGINAEKLSDISKDVSDKLGDFIATGGGEFKDFFENVAPLVGLTAKELQHLSGSEVLVAVKKAMDEANISYEEQVFYLESIANDASRLIPLLEDNGRALKESAAEAKEFGLALSEVDEQKLLDAKEAADKTGAVFTGLKKLLAAEFAPAFEAVMNQARNLILDLKGEALALAEVFGNIFRSLAGWAAVGSGRLPVLQFALMDAEELAAWLERDKLGLAAIDKQIAELIQRRDNIRYSIYDGGRTSTAEKEAINAEIAALKAEQKEIEAVAAKKREAEGHDRKTPTRSETRQIKEDTDSKKDADEYVDSWEHAYRNRYEIQSRTLQALIDQEAEAATLSAEKTRAASQEKILALELERLEASKLPTAEARSAAYLTIDRTLMKERVSLKQQELAALKALTDTDQAEIIRKESELSDMRLEVARVELEGQREIARSRLEAMDESWRQSAESIQQYRQAVTEAYHLGLLEAEEYNERMVAASEDLGAAMRQGFKNALDGMRTDAELVVDISSEIPDRLATGLGNIASEATRGFDAAKEAAADWARSTLNWLSQIILKQMILNALQAFMGGGGGGAAAGATTLSNGATLNPSGVVFGMADGGPVPGWSPSPTADNIPAWLTAKEFVQPVRAVDFYGLNFMESIRRLQFPRNLAHALAGGTLPRIPRSYHLASGGMVPAGQAPTTTVKAGDTKIAVVNLEDKSELKRFLNSSSFDTILINRFMKNTKTIKTILGS